MPASCPALTDPDHTEWSLCPSTPAAILFMVLFALATLSHFLQALYYRKTYCWVIIGSALAQTITYICRIISIKNPNNLGPYAAWFVIILIAPLFTNAFVYMAMGSPLKTPWKLRNWMVLLRMFNLTSDPGRMIWNFIPDAKLYRVTAWRFSAYFVIFDIIALLIQVAGASSSGASRHANQQVLNAIHIYMGGVAVQQFFILVFLLYAIKFHRLVLHRIQQGTEGVSSVLPLLYAIYAVLLLITIRIVFRLVEYSHGFESHIPSHEAYQYALDSVPMLLALVVLNLFHPGRIMPGKDSDFPSRKERKVKGVCKKAVKSNESSTFAA